MRDGYSSNANSGSADLYQPGARLPSVRNTGFGLFASALLAGALGLGAFCVSCFLSILSILFYNQAGHHAVDYADSYRYIALPIGVAALVGSGIVLLGLWFRRRLRP